LRQLPRLFIEGLRHRKTFVLVAGCQVSADRSLFRCRDHDVPTDSVRSRQAVVGRARHAVAMVQGVGAIESEHRDAVTETPQGGQGQAGLHADPGIAERRGHGPKSDSPTRAEGGLSPALDGLPRRASRILWPDAPRYCSGAPVVRDEQISRRQLARSR